MLGLADVSVRPFSLLPCIFCRYEYAAYSPCIHVGSHPQTALSSSAPLPQSPSQMGSGNGRYFSELTKWETLCLERYLCYSQILCQFTSAVIKF